MNQMRRLTFEMEPRKLGIARTSEPRRRRKIKSVSDRKLPIKGKAAQNGDEERVSWNAHSD
jgi:hypothetical protein